MSRFRYRRWDGTQDPFEFDVPVDELISEFNENLLHGWGTEMSLQKLLEEGMSQRFAGLQELRERLERMREAARQRVGTDDPLAEVRDRLSEIVEQERGALADSDDADARFREVVLDALPPGIGRQIEELQQYEVESSEAEAAFNELMDDLRQQLLDAQFQQLADGMGGISQDEMARVKDMLADLNEMLDERTAGSGPTQERFEQFMNDHGDFFPENPQTLDELLEALARRAAAFSRFMASLTSAQRDELRQLSESLLSDLDFQFQIDRMSESLRMLAPGLPWDEPTGDGQGSQGMSATLGAIDELSQIEELERMLAGDYAGASLDDIDRELLEEVMGEEAARDLERLRQIEKALEEAGLVVRAEGRLELTPRGVRRMGERALSTVFDRIRADRPGSHNQERPGTSGESTGSTRPWQFGDPFRLDLRRTLHNAVVRSDPDSGPLSIRPEDFEIAEAERHATVATALLLDMSRSMPLRGHWLPAKRMALALHSLISGLYPEDHLTIIGFSDYARILQPVDLAEIDWEPVYGTNMEHAFNLAGRRLARHTHAHRQILLVTDGEPTAHLEGDRVFFQWPPAPQTLGKTLREAIRLARSGIKINVFMLEQTPGLSSFVDRLAQATEGAVFSVGGSDLGDMIVRDYVKKR